MTMYKVGGVTGVSGTLGLMSAPVLAAGKEETPNGVLKVDELSLYTVPQQTFRYVEPEVGQVEQGVSSLRKMAEPYITKCQQTSHSIRQRVKGVYEKVKPKVDGAIQFGQDSYVYLQNPPPEFYPRAGVIGFAGILGLFLARGSRLKKLIYPAGLMSLGTAMYYPQQAANIAKNTGDCLYDCALQAYVAVETLVKPSPKPITEKNPEDKASAQKAT